MNELLMNWKLAEIIDSWAEDDHEPTPDEEAIVSILLLIEDHADELLILSNKYSRADSAVVSGFYALDAMQRRGVPGSIQTRFLKKLRLAACRLFDIRQEEMERLMKNRLSAFSSLIRNANNLTSISDEAALLFSYDIKYNGYVDFFHDSPVILMDFSTQSQILMESKAFFSAVFPMILKSVNKFGVPAPAPASSHTYQAPRQPAPSNQPKPIVHSKEKDGLYKWIPLVIALLIAVLLLAIISAGEEPAVPKETLPPEITKQAASPTLPPEPAPKLNPVSTPVNGHIFEDLTARGVAPFSVSGSGDMYLVLDPIDLSASVKSGMGQAEAELIEGYMELRVFIRSGKTFEIDVPLGIYEVYYATGDTWYGEEHLFGPDTQYYKCDSNFDFTEDSKGYNGWTLTLTAVYNGNLDTDAISAGDFPK